MSGNWKPVNPWLIVYTRPTLGDFDGYTLSLINFGTTTTLTPTLLLSRMSSISFNNMMTLNLVGQDGFKGVGFFFIFFNIVVKV